jgi:hypothetical protein
MGFLSITSEEMLELTPKHVWQFLIYPHHDISVNFQIVHTQRQICQDVSQKFLGAISFLNMRCEAMLQHQDMSMSVAIRFREARNTKDVPCNGR